MTEIAGGARVAARDLTALDERARGLSLGWPIALTAAVLYGSLLPFDIDWTAYQASNGFGLFELTLREGPREDILTNILVYTPIGLAFVLCGGTGTLARWSRVPFAVLVGVVVSLVAETLQAGIAGRVASWTDVALNTLGTITGAVLGATLYGARHGATRWARRELSERPFTTMASILTFGLFLYNLVPFDFITDTAGLHTSFGRARWDLTAVRPSDFGNAPYGLMIGQLGGAAWFAALGYLLALAAGESGQDRFSAAGSAIKHGFILASLAEFMQLFTASHRFDLAVIVLRTLAVIFGAWCAVFLVVGRGDSSWRQRPGLAIPTVLLLLLAVFQVLARLLSSFDPTLWSVEGVDLAHVRWVPFERLWHWPMAKAVSDILSVLLTYGTLALTLAIILRRVRAGLVWVIAGAVVTLVALGVEVLQCCSVSGTPDLTGPALAVIAVIGSSSLCRPILAAFPVPLPAPSRSTPDAVIR
ncbi:MAG: VanZ family protein [Phycisphaerales bacterium]|nr:MAG: VanZ family protein [Phycisphaerales bacterium]